MRRGFLFLLLTLLLCFFSVSHSHAAVTLRLQVPVLAGYALEVPSELAFPDLAPGEINEQEIGIRVRSNVPWTLMLAVSNAPCSMKFKNWEGAWVSVAEGPIILVRDGGVTREEWQYLDIPIRVRPDFSLDPKEYLVLIEFTLVVQL